MACGEGSSADSPIARDQRVARAATQLSSACRGYHVTQLLGSKGKRVLVKFSSAGPVFFRQGRIGRRFRTLFICKFRSMVQDAPKLGGQITFGEDPRITRVGHILRKTKIEELPQLINLLVAV